MPKYQEVRSALKAALATITVANDYSFNLAEENISLGWGNQGQPQKGASAYPACLVASEGNGYEAGPSRRLTTETSFTLVLTFSRAYESNEPTLDEVVEKVYEDIENFVDRNTQFGGVDIARLVAIADDLGTSSTEAIVVAEIAVTYRRSFT